MSCILLVAYPDKQQGPMDLQVDFAIDPLELIRHGTSHLPSIKQSLGEARRSLFCFEALLSCVKEG